MKKSKPGCGSGCLGVILICFVIGLFISLVKAVVAAIGSIWLFQEPPETIATSVGWFVAPGAWLFSYIWITPHTWFGLIAAFLLSWWLYVTSARLAWAILGRVFGFYNPAHFHFFSRSWLWWRPVYRRVWLPVSWWIEENFRMGKFSTGRVAGGFETMAHVYRPGDIYLGRLRIFGIPLFQPIGIDGRGGKHLCMIAGTGGGKTTHLISMLGLHEGTAFIIDPKGQIASVIARRMGEGGNGVIGKGMKVCIFDPSGLVPEHRSLLAKWNPFVELQSAADRAAEQGLSQANAIVDFAQKIVTGLIVQDPKQDPFWTSASRDFLHGLILHVFTTEPPAQQTLGRLYQLLSVGLPEESPEDVKTTGFNRLLWAMSQNQNFGGVVAQSVAGMENAAAETSGSVLMTMREQLQWLKLPAMQEVSEESSFRLEELHKGKLVLFVCAKFTDIKTTFPGWFRLLSILALAVFEDIRRPLKHPCLFVLDEFPSLGKIEPVEVAAPTMRSYGVRLLIIAQDTGQLRGLYENWETFIGNSECTWWMATKHSDSLCYLETKLGKATVKNKRSGPREQEVMTADQIERFLNHGNVIVTRGDRPFRLRPELYFKALPVCFYDPDKNFKESGLRSITRDLFAKYLHTDKVSPPAIPEEFAPAPSELMPRWDENPAFEVTSPPPYFGGTVVQEANDMDDPEPELEADPDSPPIHFGLDKWPDADPEFVRLFVECFGEEGRYPTVRLRRIVYDGFSENLLDGGDFQTLHADFEDWLTSTDATLEKSESERVGGFFDRAVNRSQKVRKTATVDR